MNDEIRRGLEEYTLNGLNNLNSGNLDPETESEVFEQVKTASGILIEDEKNRMEFEDKAEKRRIDEKKHDETLEAEKEKDKDWKRTAMDIFKVAFPVVTTLGGFFIAQAKEMDYARDPDGGIRTTQSHKKMGFPNPFRKIE